MEPVLSNCPFCDHEASYEKIALRSHRISCGNTDKECPVECYVTAGSKIKVIALWEKRLGGSSVVFRYEWVRSLLVFFDFVQVNPPQN